MTRKYNTGLWTKARFNSFVKSALRSASQRWPPKYAVIAKAFTTKKVNPKTGRVGKHFECARCKLDFPQKEVEVNHITSVVPVTGFDSWDGVIERMFCEEDGLELVCKPCHKIISQGEREQRKRS